MSARVARPSAAWKTAEEHAKDESPTSSFWLTVPFDKLERYAEDLCPARSPCHANRTKYARGHHAVVIELVFDDDEVWVVRLRMPIVFGKSVSGARLTREMETEAATLKYIRENTSLPVPTIFAYSSTADNVVGMPFTIMSAVCGISLNDLGVPDPALAPKDRASIVDCYIEGLAFAVSELSKHRFDTIGSLYFDPTDSSKYVVGPVAHTGLGPFSTATEYYSACADKMERECLSLPDDSPAEREGRAFVLWLFRLALSSISSSRDNSGPFILTHHDIHQGNVLCDEQGNMVGLIDWGYSGVYPVDTFVAQCWECLADASDPTHYNILSHRPFGAALSQLESPDSTFPSGRTLAQAHSSTTSYVFGNLLRLLMGPDQCRENYYAGMLARPVVGGIDIVEVKKSTLFREWYAATLLNIQSV